MTTRAALYAAGAGLSLVAGLAGAAVVPFAISGTYTQGSGIADIPDTSIGLGGAGSFILDPGARGDSLDFTRPDGGFFSTTTINVSGQFFLRSYAAGERIGFGDFVFLNSAFHPGFGGYTILSPGVVAGIEGIAKGAWSESHDGYLGIATGLGSYGMSDVRYGWIEYSFTRSQFPNRSTITFLRGAYSDVAEDAVTAGFPPTAGAVPIPATIALLGLGLVGIGTARRRQA
jgi:hypothetical protein